MAGAVIGAAPTVPGTSAQVSLGRRNATGGKEYVYVQAASAITGAGYVCTIDPSTYQAAMVSTSNDAAVGLVGVPEAAFASGDYGWLQVLGACTIRVLASCAANVRLNTTGTAGALDDDGTAGSFAINGAFLTTAAGGAAATVAGFINYPSQSVVAL
jgi:hypothetical protein